MEEFTFEEIGLMSIYYSAATTRRDMIRSLIKMRGYLDQDEESLLTLTDATISKLNAISDEVFMHLEIYPDYGNKNGYLYKGKLS